MRRSSASMRPGWLTGLRRCLRRPAAVKRPQAHRSARVPWSSLVFAPAGWRRDRLDSSSLGHSTSRTPRPFGHLVGFSEVAWTKICSIRAFQPVTRRDHRGERHSITSSARERRESGIVRPSDLAVLRLMISSNLVGCSIGRSFGLAPFRTLSTQYGRAAGHLEKVWSIRDQPTILHVFPRVVHRR
jgi:hypothetical protein